MGRQGELKYNPSTTLVYRDGAVIGHVATDKRSGILSYVEFRFDPVEGITGKDLKQLLGRIKAHEERSHGQA